MEKPEYLYETNKELPSEEECPVCVALNYDKKHKQFHCGIAYRISGETNVLHLETYKRTSHNSDFHEFSHIVKPSIHPIRLKLMIPFCRLVQEKVACGELKIPYGLNYNGYSDIDRESGRLNLTEGTNGLTCATFVMTMFHSTGIDLIDVANWPHREEDNEWKKHTIDILIRFMDYLNISDTFIQNLINEESLVRFKPQEVAASSTLYNNGPAATEQIINEGQRTKDYMTV